MYRVLSTFQKKVFLPYSGNAEHEANNCNPLWSFIVYLAERLGLPQVYVVYDTFCCLGAMGHFVAGNQDLMLILFWYKLEVARLK